MLEDGFKSDRYSSILGNLRENKFLDAADVDCLLKDFVAHQHIKLDCVSDEKAKMVSEALIDNYNRQKFK